MRETAGLAEAAQHVGGAGNGLFGYENQRETMRTAFSLLKNPAATDTAMAAFPRSVRDWMDFLPLPDYDQVAKYFYFSVYGGAAKADVAAAGFVHALKLLQRLQACRPAEPADSPEEALRDGRAALCLTDAPWLKTFQKTPALHDKIGVCRMPGGERYFDFDTSEPHPTPEGNRVPYLAAPAGCGGAVKANTRRPLSICWPTSAGQRPVRRSF